MRYNPIDEKIKELLGTSFYDLCLNDPDAAKKIVDFIDQNGGRDFDIYAKEENEEHREISEAYAKDPDARFLKFMLNNATYGSDFMPIPSQITWADGSDKDITTMLKWHYTGMIDIRHYWHIGDTRKVTLPAIDNVMNLEMQPKQDIELTIIGFNHDILVEKDGFRRKAAITVQVKDCLYNPGIIDSDKYYYPYSSTWVPSERKWWCNKVFRDALPEYIQNLIKPVFKTTNVYDDDPECYIQDIGCEDIFFLSEGEIYGRHILCIPTSKKFRLDGIQYEYMKNEDNRMKKPGSTITNSSNRFYWTRTSFIGSHGLSYMVIHPCGVSNNKYKRLERADKIGEIAPAFCL